MFVATAFVVCIVTGLILFVPATTISRRADALLVLAPADDRMLYAQELMDEGIAGTLAVSVPRGHEVQLAGICNSSCPTRSSASLQNPLRRRQRLGLCEGWPNSTDGRMSLY